MKPNTLQERRSKAAREYALKFFVVTEEEKSDPKKHALRWLIRGYVEEAFIEGACWHSRSRRKRK